MPGSISTDVVRLVDEARLWGDTAQNKVPLGGKKNW